jgi:hypothetical protein
MEVVMWEWSSVREGRWEDLPVHGERKQEILKEMARYDWALTVPDQENTELMVLQSQIIDLEYQLKKMIENRMNIIATQLDGLKSRHATWNRTVNPYRTALAAAGMA